MVGLAAAYRIPNLIPHLHDCMLPAHTQGACLLAKQREHDRHDSPHAVLGLWKDEGLRPVEDLTEELSGSFRTTVGMLATNGTSPTMTRLLLKSKLSPVFDCLTSSVTSSECRGRQWRKTASGEAWLMSSAVTYTPGIVKTTTW